jgi:phage/plasmid-like protein (TIGR03299 family)
MAHEITETDGAVFARNPAWHGLGVVLKDAPDSETAINTAKLNWQVRSERISLLGDGTEIKTHRANVREDTKAILGIVGEDYQIVQNHEAFKVLDHLIPDGVLKYESAFSIRGGKVVNLLAKLPEQWKVAEGDEVLSYVLLSNGHDGYHSLDIVPTNIRVVCANTWRAALVAGKRLTLSLRHTKGIKERAEAAVKLLAKARSVCKVDIDRAKALVTRLVKDAEFYKYLDEVFGAVPDKAAGRAYTNAVNVRDDVEERYFTGKHQQIPSIKRSAWAAVNAVTEHADYYRTDGKVTEKLFLSSTEGSRAEVKDAAFSAAEKVFFGKEVLAGV